MMITTLRVSLLLSLLVTLVHTLTPNTFLTGQDKTRLSNLFTLNEPYVNIPLNDLYYSLVGSSVITNDKIFTLYNTQQVKKLCNYLETGLTESNPTLDSLYYASSASKLLNCQIQPALKAVSFLEGNIKADATVPDFKLLKARLTKDDTLASSGFAFQLAALLEGAENYGLFLEKINDVIIQADEVDGRYLQFEGGLAITANIISGIYSLASSAGKPPGLNNVRNQLYIAPRSIVRAWRRQCVPHVVE